MTPEEQAATLREWLQATPGSAVPEGLDVDVVEAIFALRPDLAPAPRVTADDILAGLATGPLAARSAVAGQAEIVAFPGAAASEPVPPAETTVAEADGPASPRRRAWLTLLIGGGGAATLLAAAAALAIVAIPPLVRGPGGADESAPVAMRERSHDEAEKTEAKAPEGAASTRSAPAAPAVIPEATPRPATLRVSKPLEGREDAAELLETTPGDVGAGFGQRQGGADLAVGGEGSTTAPAGTTLGPSARRSPVEAVTTTPMPDPAPPPAEPEPEDKKARDVAGAKDRVQRPGVAGLPTVPHTGTETGEFSAADLTSRGYVDDLPAPPLQLADEDPVEESVVDVDELEAGDLELDGVTTAESVSTRADRNRAEKRKVSKEDRGSAPKAAEIARSAPAAGRAFAEAPMARLQQLQSEAHPRDFVRATPSASRDLAVWREADTLATNGRYAEAAEKLTAIIEPPPEQGQVRAADAARYWSNADRPDLAVNVVQKGLDLGRRNTPEYSYLLWVYGNALMQLGDRVGAEAAYREAIDLNRARQEPPALDRQSNDAMEANDY